MDKGARREPGAELTPPGEVLGSDGSDTPPSEAATPRGNSPETVNWRAALQGCQVNWGSASEADEPPTRPTEKQQPSGPPSTDHTDGYRESRAQPTSLGSRPDATGPDTQPRDVTTPQGDYPAKFDWRVVLKDNTYRYDRLVEPVGPTERTGRRDMPYKTTATLNLQPIRTLTRWSNEPLGSGGGFDKGPREDIRRRGHAPSSCPISHNNIWERATAELTCATPSGVYDGGGGRVPETPPDTNDNRSCVAQPEGGTSSRVYDGGGERVPETPPNANDDRPIRYYTIRVDKLKKQINKGPKDKLKLCTAATQSQDSVATQPTTQ